MHMSQRIRIILVLFVGLYGNLFSVSAQPETVATLEPAQGVVQLRRHAAVEDAWQTVTQPELVREGDSIRTGPLGLAYLIFFEGAESEILPDSIITVERLTFESPEQFDLSARLLVGDMLSQVAHIADASSRYEIQTPSAVIAVRGTAFWISVFADGAARVRVFEGRVLITGLDSQGAPVDHVTLDPGSALTVSPAGELGPVAEFDEEPLYPPRALLAPLTCGDDQCTDAEADTCPLDCRELPDCGDERCDRAGEEGPLSCPEDCMPPAPELLTRLHFFWAEMRCELDPPTEPATGPFLMHWGIGCFDSEAQAAAHPHPARYQLIINGTPVDMSSLRQSAPHRQSPYCPWGWRFDMEPVVLPPGEHTFQLIETVTDTWRSESGGRKTGDVATLTCTLTVAAP